MVHVFQVNGCRMAVDVNSGSVHCLDEVSYSILKAFPFPVSQKTVIEKFKGQYGKDVLRESWHEIEELRSQGLLYSPDLDEEMLTRHMALTKDHGIKALCLHTAHDCNMGCRYCFASKGDYNTRRSLMSEEVAYRAVDYLLDHSGSLKNVEIDFFGGEPLLNFEVIKKTVSYARKVEGAKNKKVHFTITTNGLPLDQEKMDYINEHMDNVVISLDGRKSVHDAMRPDRGGSGTYHKIVSRAKDLVNGRKGKSYFIRGTYTAWNLDFSEDVFHIADLGFKEVSVEPVVGKGEPFHITEEHLPVILNEYEKLARKYVDYIREGKEFSFYHFNLNLYGGPCVQRRIIACGAGFEYLAVSPEGDIYPCHQLVGQDSFKMGDVFEGIQKPEISEHFKNCSILTKKECRECWAKYYCSGGCHANAYYSNGDIHVPNELACIMQRKRIECAMTVEMARAEMQQSQVRDDVS